MDDIRPLFFATQVSAEFRRPQTQQIRSKLRHENDQQHSLSPYQRLKRMKLEMQKSRKQYFKTLSQNHRLQLSLSKLQRKKHTTRNQFIKVYGNLKYKKFLQDSRNQNESMLRNISREKVDRTKKRKLEQQLQRMLSKNQEQQKIQILQQKNKRDKQKLQQIKQRKKGDLSNWSKNKHDTIKSQQTQFVIRKSNISSILNQRSKLNYMKKINKELSLLKQYQTVIDQIGSFNIDQIKKLTENQERFKGYETFFMTTKNTIS